MKNLFENVAANEKNEKWNNIIKREKELYKRNNDIRSEIERDYTRIIHSTAYRRMKHKTQVFFSPENDHICTRIEHVTYVESISHTIAKYLGLNIDLTKAIATAHDLGHAPFGHEGERVLSKISQRDLGEKFWHEKNGLDFVDKIELLEDNLKNEQNLNLTYGVRDGIISHCGEIDENALVPRNEFIDLKEYKEITNFKNTKETLKNIKLELPEVPDIKDIRKVMINRDEKICNEIIKPKDELIQELYQDNVSLHKELSKQAKVIEEAEKYQNERDKILADNEELHNTVKHLEKEYKKKNNCFLKFIRENITLDSQMLYIKFMGKFAEYHFNDQQFIQLLHQCKKEKAL